MIFVNIFTYKQDEQIVVLAAKSAHLVFGKECEVHIIDDNLNPISEEYKNILIQDGSFYRQSTFDRKNNLNGKECCIGIVEEFIKSCNNRDGITIKLDSDTLILHKKIFMEFIMDNNCGYMASHRPASVFSGICYCIKNKILNKVLYNLRVLDIDKDLAPEDMVIGAVSAISAMPMSIRIITEYNEKENKGEATAWNYRNLNILEAYKLYYEQFQICTFGNWYLHNGLTKFDILKPMNGVLSLINK